MPDHKITNWTQAINAARKRADGRMVGVAPATLRAMEKRGAVYQSDEGSWFLTDEERGPAPAQNPPVDVSSGVPGTLYVQDHGDLSSVGRPESFSVQYYLGTTIDGRWDKETGELVLSTPGDIFDLVVRARPDGTMGLRLVNRKD